jgi:hypothetical protein
MRQRHSMHRWFKTQDTLTDGGRRGKGGAKRKKYFNRIKCSICGELEAWYFSDRASSTIPRLVGNGHVMIWEHLVTIQLSEGPSMYPTFDVRGDWLLISRMHRNGNHIPLLANIRTKRLILTDKIPRHAHYPLGHMHASMAPARSAPAR